MAHGQTVGIRRHLSRRPWANLLPTSHSPRRDARGRGVGLPTAARRAGSLRASGGVPSRTHTRRRVRAPLSDRTGGRAGGPWPAAPPTPPSFPAGMAVTRQHCTSRGCSSEGPCHEGGGNRVVTGSVSKPCAPPWLAVARGRPGARSPPCRQHVGHRVCSCLRCRSPRCSRRPPPAGGPRTQPNGDDELARTPRQTTAEITAPAPAAEPNVGGTRAVPSPLSSSPAGISVSTV